MAMIIAELCQNYGGKRDILREMIYSATEAGADYVKIQTIHSNNLTYRKRFEEGLIENELTKVIKRPYQQEFDRLKAIDIDMDDHQWFVDECSRCGVKSMTTVFSRGDVKTLAEMKWDAVKVASYDCGSFPLLEDLTQHFSKIFVSTGASFDSEINRAVMILDSCDYALLHCVSIYPTPLDVLNLNRIDYLKTIAKTVGFSDHSLVSSDGIKASVAALYKGADVIERHYTIQEVDKTKDGPISITPDQLKELAYLAKAKKEEVREYVESNIPEFSKMLGQKNRELTHEELLNRDYYRGRFGTRLNDGTWQYNWED